MTTTNTRDTSRNANSAARTSRKLSWLLRHGAGEAGLAMDAAGWARIDDVMARLRCSRATLDHAVAHNNKSRFTVEGDRIRATQGHSRDTMPVELDALEASWARYNGRDTIWHGTHPDAVEGIAREGIHAGRRTHVHLAATLDSRVGKRANVHIMLGVSATRLRQAGHEVFVSPNGVVLTRAVPADCIVELRSMTRRAQALRSEHLALLGLDKAR